jgi:NAD+ synthase (glutamine-hydrolysing)
MRCMPTLRIALAQVNSTVGDIAGNAAAVRRWSRTAAEAGAQLIAFPEMMLTGYPIEDLVFRNSFVAASRSALTTLAKDLASDGLGDLAVVVGYVDADGPPRTSSESAPGRGRRDASALLLGGEVAATYFKHHLPNYGVFDEDRYFEPGSSLTVVRFGGVDVALTVWRTCGRPVARSRRLAGPASGWCSTSTPRRTS